MIEVCAPSIYLILVLRSNRIESFHVFNVSEIFDINGQVCAMTVDVGAQGRPNQLGIGSQ